MTGFVIGLAVTITIGQLPALLGIPPVDGTTFERLVGIGQETLALTDPTTAILGIGSLVGILLLKRIAPRIPGALVALIVGIIVSTALDLPAQGVAVVGDVATGVPLPSIPSIPFGDVVFLITGAFGIVFLALAESIGAARSFAARHGYDIDPDQELIALGASNVASGLFGGFAVDASLSQSATGEAAGDRTQVVVADHGRAGPGHGRRPGTALPQPADRRPGRHRHHLGDRTRSTSASSAATTPGSGPTSCWR